MAYADKIYKSMITDIHEYGEWDFNTNVRTKYADGTSAYTNSVFGNQIVYPKGVIPLLTIKKVFVKTAIKEAILFWVKQSVKEKDFNTDNVSIWDEWFKSDGTLGKSYAYQFESRPTEIEPITRIDVVDVELKEYVGQDLVLPKDYKSKVANYAPHELTLMLSYWHKMIHKYKKGELYICEEWFDFDTFITDVRWIPQFFLAKENEFKDYSITCNNNQGYYSKDTCYWFDINEPDRKISRNQVVELIKQIKTNPKSRRLMTSFWNFKDVEDKALMECCYETRWKVKNGNELELILKIRSNDLGLGNPFNTIQYKLLQMVIAQCCGLEAGKFIVNIDDLHYYCRHAKTLDEHLSYREYDEPVITINPNLKDFFSFTHNDVNIEYYEHGPFVPFEVAI